MTYNSIDPDPMPACMDVRLATGNILPEDYTDENIVKKIKSAYSKIQLGIRKTLDAPLESIETGFDHCVQLEISLAAMYCLKAYGPEFLDKITELRTETTEDMLFIQEALGIATGNQVIVVDEPLEEGTVISTAPKGWYKAGDFPPNRMKPYRKAGDIEGIGIPRLDPLDPLS